VPASANITDLTYDFRDDNTKTLLTTDVMAVTQLPTSDEEITKLRRALDLRLLVDFRAKPLSDAEQHSLTNNTDDFQSKFVRDKWDSYICSEAAPRYGARLLLSDAVMLRVWSWQCGEKDGTRKLKNLFHEIWHSACVGLRQSKGRITPSYRARKGDFVNELTELQTHVRDKWPDSAAGVRRLAADTIEATPRRFQYLTTNRASLMLMLSDDSTALRFRGKGSERMRGDLTPTKFYELWVASATNRRPESVRQDLTTL
jgi:hypothetical protein